MQTHIVDQTISLQQSG